MNIIKANTISLEKELTWFSRVLDIRISLYFEQECEYDSIYDIPPPIWREMTQNMPVWCKNAG